MARRRLYTTHNIYMLGCIHITLTECTFVFCAPSSIQCLQALPTIIKLVTVLRVSMLSLKCKSVHVERGNFSLVKKVLTLSFIRVSTLSLLRVTTFSLLRTFTVLRISSRRLLQSINFHIAESANCMPTLF
jgi:hypothetical protein